MNIFKTNKENAHHRHKKTKAHTSHTQYGHNTLYGALANMYFLKPIYGFVDLVNKKTLLKFIQEKLKHYQF